MTTQQEKDRCFVIVILLILVILLLWLVDMSDREYLRKHGPRNNTRDDDTTAEEVNSIVNNILFN